MKRAVTLSIAVMMAALAIAACGGDSGTTPPPDTSPQDVDRDGFASDIDCNDQDANVFPGADERCDGVDNNCNDSIDENPVDALTLWRDEDGDGFGDPANAVTVCEVSPGLVDNDDDCDDSSDQARPGGVEICDSLDNDCDGQADAQRVPEDYATLTEALAATADDAEICLSPGTHVATVDASGVRRTIIGAGGPGSTIINMASADRPFIVSDGAGSVLTLRGVSVRGLDTSIESLEQNRGRLLRVTNGASVTLDNVVLEDHAITLPNDGNGSLGTGLLLYAEDATLTLRDVVARNISARMEQATAGPAGISLLSGVVLQARNTALNVDGFSVSDVSIMTPSPVWQCSLTGATADILAGTAVLRGVTLRDIEIDVECTDRADLWGGGLRVTNAEVTIRDASIERVRAVATSRRSSVHGPFSAVGISGSIDRMALVENRQQAEAEIGGADAHGAFRLLSVFGLQVDHLRAYDNISSGRTALGGGIDATDSIATFRWLDVRGNRALGSSQSFGGGAFLDGEYTLRNAIFADNGVAEGDGRGSALLLSTVQGTSNISHADFVGNTGHDALLSGTIVLTTNFSNRDVDFNVDHINVVGNQLAGNGDGSTLRFVGPSAEIVRWTANNAFNNSGASPFADIVDPVGSNGNLAVDPQFVSTAGDDAKAWDLTLQAGSPVIDNGDPSIMDADGSRADIGAYGGPDGDDWAWP